MRKKLICRHTNPSLIAYIVIFNSMLFAMSMDIHLPAMPLMVKELNASEFQVQLTIIFFAIGSIFSRLLWGPMSDIHGRRKILISTIIIQLIGQTGCCLSYSIESLLTWRAFQSLGAGVSSVIGTAIIADLFKGRMRASMYGLLEMSFPIGFVIAPVIGSLLVDYTGSWRINFYFILFLMLVTFMMSYTYVPETHDDLIQMRFSKMLSQYFRFIKNKLFMIYSMIMGLIIGNQMIFVINAPFVYMTDLGLSPTEYAFYQLMPMVCNFICVLLFRKISKVLEIDSCLNIGMVLSGLQVPFFLFFAYYWQSLTPNTILAMICFQTAITPFLIPTLVTKALDMLPANRGSASSLIGSMKSICISIGMLVGGYVLGSSIGPIMLIMGCVTALVVATYYLARACYEEGQC